MIITNGIIITPFKVLYELDVIIHSGIIIGFKERGTYSSENEEIVDATGCYICPGFVDIHTHGGGGSDFMDASYEDYCKALSFHSSNGTTSLLTSTVTAPVDQIKDVLAMTRKLKDKVVSGCRVLGVHLEGPFLSKKNKGAHVEKFLLTPEENGYTFVEENDDVIVNVTISPELPGSIKMIKDLTKLGIIVSGGHDDATDDDIYEAIDAGLTNLTHIFCAMSSVANKKGRRRAGLTEIGLIDERLSVELIADNHHLPPELVRLVYKCKGPQKACVVSDCLRAGGMPSDGTTYALGPRNDPHAQQVVIKGDVASLPDGSRLAGSIQPISRMVRNLVQYCGIPLVDAVCMGSFTPARIIGKEQMIGSIAPGKKADLCVMDSSLIPKVVIVDGNIIFHKKMFKKESVL